jgi:primosomal protein N''
LTDGWEDDMAGERNSFEQERELLVQCVAEAHEALEIMAGVDENGPILVWLADHLLGAHTRAEQPA